MLTGALKTQRMASAFTFLERYYKNGDEFLDHIVRLTGDETWASFVNVETEEQSKHWMNTHSPNKPRKFKQTFSARNPMSAVFWDRREVLVVEFMQHGTTITSEVYCETLKKLRRAIHNKRRGMPTYDVVLHDCASVYICSHWNTAGAFKLGVV
jgi:hypothetical protein